MPRTLWILACKTCRIVFTHTEKDAAASKAADQPRIPAGGKELECPHCHVESTYKRADLKYHFHLD